MAIQNHIDDLTNAIARFQADKIRLEAKRDGMEAAYAAMTPETQEMAKALHDNQCQTDHAYCGGLNGPLESVDWTQEEPKDWLRIVMMALGIYQDVVGGGE